MSALPHLDVFSVHPQIRVAIGQRAMTECLHQLVQLRAQPGHLALADACHAQGLHQLIHFTGADGPRPGKWCKLGSSALSAIYTPGTASNSCVSFNPFRAYSFFIDSWLKYRLGAA